jgi:hypothetical protein
MGRAGAWNQSRRAVGPSVGGLLGPWGGSCYEGSQAVGPWLFS